MPEIAPVDICFALGGDGTILSALRTYAGTGVPVFGINFGEVGFLAASTRRGARGLRAGARRRVRRLPPAWDQAARARLATDRDQRRRDPAAARAAGREPRLLDRRRGGRARPLRRPGRRRLVHGSTSSRRLPGRSRRAPPPPATGTSQGCPSAREDPTGRCRRRPPRAPAPLVDVDDRIASKAGLADDAALPKPVTADLELRLDHCQAVVSDSGTGQDGRQHLRQRDERDIDHDQPGSVRKLVRNDTAGVAALAITRGSSRGFQLNSP